nr:hypothetical protein RVX_1562 [Nitratidesulfovibrio sp. HK-II]
MHTTPFSSAAAALLSNAVGMHRLRVSGCGCAAALGGRDEPRVRNDICQESHDTSGETNFAPRHAAGGRARDAVMTRGEMTALAFGTRRPRVPKTGQTAIT